MPGPVKAPPPGGLRPALTGPRRLPPRLQAPVGDWRRRLADMNPHTLGYLDPSSRYRDRPILGKVATFLRTLGALYPAAPRTLDTVHFEALRTVGICSAFKASAIA
jgi:hypothetical protein